MIADPRVVQWMIRAAEKKKIPYQREVLLMGGTDARAIQTHTCGCAIRLHLHTRSLCPFTLRNGGLFRRAELCQIVDCRSPHKDRSGIMARTLRITLYRSLWIVT